MRAEKGRSDNIGTTRSFYSLSIPSNTCLGSTWIYQELLYLKKMIE
jgi:hypothetical protein